MTGPAGRRVSAASVARWFEDCHGSWPEGVWQAPGRANLIGEHTDYNDGWVLPFALDRGVVVAASRRDDGILQVRSRQAGDGPVTLRLADIGPGAVPGWAAYPAGVAWALREARRTAGGASLVIDSDLPRGAGLSSSAALECAVALALTDLRGVRLPRAELAALARRAENDMVGVPSGIMDQSASLLCREGHALLLDCRTAEHEAVPLAADRCGLELLLVDTGVRHALTDGRYARRREECERAARELGAGSLRDVAVPAARLADPLLRRRARHVLTENQRVHEAVALLRDGDVAGVGPLLLSSHASLREDFEVSWAEADVAVEAAAGAGAPGARMIGGGFGGSVLVLAPAGSSRVRAAVSEAFAGRGWRPPRFLPAPPSAGGRRLR